MSVNRVIFVVQHLGQPRCIKRILSIKEAGYDVLVYGFDRGIYSDNIKQLLEHDVQIRESVSTKGLSRFRKIFAYVGMTMRAAREASKNDVIYAFGFELATFTRLFTSSRYIYECADVVGARLNSKLLLMFDRRTIRKAEFTVFTSEGFVDFFYGKEVASARKTYVVQPNKLNGYFLEHRRPDVKPIDSDKIRFGFAGCFRYLNVYLSFSEIIGKYYPNHELHFWGDGDESAKKKIRDMADAYPNIYYHGVFTNPADLDRVYDTFDVCVLCYDIKSGNVKIAEPNKLYESIYYGKPVVVSKGTFLGEKVEKLGVGEAIDIGPEGIRSYLDNIPFSTLNEMILNEKQIQTEDLVYNAKELLAFLQYLW